MPKSISDNKKSRGRPATGQGTLIGVRLQPELLDPLDKAAANLSETSRPETIRRIIRSWLVEHGFLTP
ncbi:ribbon-helix-helix domain-containing protein [Mesorhizobium sp. B4-1-1]|uniref:CopG family ribbon-helix-helix protein n=1 Tax=Mesorhizobium sp. B4-1-1 TaxID=2589890 RepID=UPI00112D9013|nr:ribbon-helix-helix domain-containing protein [Mesorhizobium sp. B4-1-1]TPI13871.1 ribbon-helix-helix protein, CopG family [Mesorhizobium sp. B4-1-1]